MRTITRPTTSTAYCATAITVPLERLAAGSSDSMPGASPEASCHDPVATSPFPFFFFDPPSALAESSLAELTTDHPPAAVVEAD